MLWIVISSTSDALAAMKSRKAAARGKSMVTENVICPMNLKKSIASHIWNPIARSPAIMLTLAWRKNAL